MTVFQEELEEWCEEYDNEFSDLDELHTFEFMPDNSEPLLLSQVSPGMTCEVIVTNRAGLYRYRTGIRISLVEHLPQGNAIIRIVE